MPKKSFCDDYDDDDKIRLKNKEISLSVKTEN